MCTINTPTGISSAINPEHNTLSFTCRERITAGPPKKLQSKQKRTADRTRVTRVEKVSELHLSNATDGGS